ncbi:ABC transporter substrate-binding protein [Paracoccus aminophilus]|uniref:ABC-type dipeptide transport system, periplasmic component n=1 Tax=Paracoccus aminophilus JCM 7686 TaxID=1367847 RepID=S5YTA7_PARAH|nr:ABC transporter substrate-binding protein [Paracoccus aminophilus]AGT08461.1 ABC-type dipeptide transport system, periplasmic component [Paracoccus aminophilus JCM 7686]
MTHSLSTPSRRQFLLSASALAAGSLAASVLPQKLWAASNKTVILAISAEPPALSALAHTAGPIVSVSAKVTEGLLAYDFDLKPVPQLATAWSVSDDGLTYDFTLREGVKWHDGQPFTAEDVAWSIKTIKEVHPRGRNTFLNLESIEVVDPLHVRLHLKKPAPFLLGALSATETAIVPKHIYDGTDPLTNPAQGAPIGTGPFRFKEWAKGSHVAYERNPDYWNPGEPKADQLIVRFITDPNARGIALETGEIHAAPSSPVPLSEVERYRALPNLAFETRGYEVQNGVVRLEFNLEDPVFKDIRVRRAVAHAINRDEVLQLAHFGYGVPLYTPVNPNLKNFFAPDLKSYPYDLDAAGKLLDEAGYPADANGERLRVTLDPMLLDDFYKRGGDYIKQALDRIGIKVDIRNQDYATYVKRIYTDRDFQFTYNGMSNLFDPTVGVQRLYWSKNFKRGVPFSNGSGYSNPQVDAWLEEASESTDQAHRGDLWRLIQAQLQEDVPSIYTVAPSYHTFANRALVGHTVDSAGLNANLAQIELTS